MIAGKDTIVAIVPTTTWHTAAALGVGDGVLVRSIDRISLNAEIDFDDSSGLANKQFYTRISENADPSIVAYMRWNGAQWCWFVNWVGDDTKTGAGPTYTHTLNWTENPVLVGITQGIEINNTANGILEIPSYKVTDVAFEPEGGFWNMNVTTLGDNVFHAGDATFDGTAADTVTYSTKAERMRYKANQLRINTQGGGALGAGDVIADASNMSINFNRVYDPMDDVVKGAATGTELRRAEPIETGEFPTVTLSYDQKTVDLATHLNDLDAGNEYKADIAMAETVAQAMTFDQEFNRLAPIDPAVALERGLRIPMSHSFESIHAAAAGTGMTTSTPYHAVLVNTSNISYETNA